MRSAVQVDRMPAAVNGMGMILPTVNTWSRQELPVSRRGVGVGAIQSSLFLGMKRQPGSKRRVDRHDVAGLDETFIGSLGRRSTHRCGTAQTD
jgi:hypothetical protein